MSSIRELKVVVRRSSPPGPWQAAAEHEVVLRFRRHQEGRQARAGPLAAWRPTRSTQLCVILLAPSGRLVCVDEIVVADRQRRSAAGHLESFTFQPLETSARAYLAAGPVLVACRPSGGKTRPGRAPLPVTTSRPTTARTLSATFHLELPPTRT